MRLESTQIHFVLQVSTTRSVACVAQRWRETGQASIREHGRDVYPDERGTWARPAAIQAFQPPRTARAPAHPLRLRSRATRALVASFGQAQMTASTASLGIFTWVASATAWSG